METLHGIECNYGFLVEHSGVCGKPHNYGCTKEMAKAVSIVGTVSGNIVELAIARWYTARVKQSKRIHASVWFKFYAGSTRYNGTACVNHVIGGTHTGTYLDHGTVLYSALLDAGFVFRTDTGKICEIPEMDSTRIVPALKACCIALGYADCFCAISHG